MLNRTNSDRWVIALLTALGMDHKRKPEDFQMVAKAYTSKRTGEQTWREGTLYPKKVFFRRWPDAKSQEKIHFQEEMLSDSDGEEHPYVRVFDDEEGVKRFKAFQENAVVQENEISGGPLAGLGEAEEMFKALKKQLYGKDRFRTCTNARSLGQEGGARAKRSHESDSDADSYSQLDSDSEADDDEDDAPVAKALNIRHPTEKRQERSELSASKSRQEQSDLSASDDAASRAAAAAAAAAAAGAKPGGTHPAGQASGAVGTHPAEQASGAVGKHPPGQAGATGDVPGAKRPRTRVSSKARKLARSGSHASSAGGAEGDPEKNRQGGRRAPRAAKDVEAAAAAIAFSEDHQTEFDSAAPKDKKWLCKIIPAMAADRASVSEPHLRLSMFARAVASFYLCFFMRARHMKQRPGDVDFEEA